MEGGSSAADETTEEGDDWETFVEDAVFNGDGTFVEDEEEEEGDGDGDDDGAEDDDTIVERLFFNPTARPNTSFVRR